MMKDYFLELERQYKLPQGLLNAVMMAESSGNPNAINRKTATGQPSLGLMQFQPATARSYGIDPMDPRQAALGAAKMYSDLLEQYDGDLDMALAGYNWGSGNISRHGMEKMPEETRNYIKKVTSMLPKQYAANEAAASDAIDIKKARAAAIEAAKKRYEEQSGLSDKKNYAMAAAEKRATETPSVGATARDELLQGATFGLGEEAQAALAAAIHSQMTGEDYGTSYEKALEIARTNLQRGKDENPATANVANIAGAVGTGIGAAKFAPGLAGKVTSYATKNPYKASGAIGGVSGALYGAGTGEGGIEERAGSALLGGTSGAVIGPAVTYTGRNVIEPFVQKYLMPKISPILEKMSSALKSKKPQAENALESAAKTAALNEVQDKSAQDTLEQLSKKENLLRLPKGARTEDVDLMREEEYARKGMLGEQFEKKLKLTDDMVKADAVDIMRKLTGETELEGDEQLLKGIESFMKQFSKDKKTQQELMENRNKLIAAAKLDAKISKASLGAKIRHTVGLPENSITYNMKTAGAPLRERVEYLDEILNSPSKKGNIDFNKLQAWRQDLGAFARSNAGKQEAVVANKIASSYDDWVENKLHTAIKEGDEDLAQKIFSANKEYAEFKKKYGTNRYTGQSRVIQDVLEKEELTPRQLVNTVFGKGVGSKDVSGQIVGRMIKALPKEQREPFVSDIRAGLLNRALESSKDSADNISLTKLHRELQKLRRNDVYKEYLSNENYDTVMDSLLKDLNKYNAATSRRDIVNLSGTTPMLIRFLRRMSGVPGADLIADVSEATVKKFRDAPVAGRVEKSLEEFNEELKKHIEQRSVNWSTYAPYAFSGAAQETEKKEREAQPARTKITITPQDKNELPNVNLPE
jgi:hypothetical protein